MKVLQVNGTTLRCLSLYGTIHNKKVVKDFLIGNSFVSRAVNYFSSLSEKTAKEKSTWNPIIMAMIFSKDNKDSSLIEDIMMLQMMSSNPSTFSTGTDIINQILMMKMFEEGEEGSKNEILEKFLMLQMINNNKDIFNGNGFTNLFSSPLTKNEEIKEVNQQTKEEVIKARRRRKKEKYRRRVY